MFETSDLPAGVVNILTGSRDHLPSRSRSRPMSTDLDQLAEEFENVAIDKKRLVFG